MCLSHTQQALNLAQSLGFHTNRLKSYQVPSQTVLFSRVSQDSQVQGLGRPDLVSVSSGVSNLGISAGSHVGCGSSCSSGPPFQMPSAKGVYGQMGSKSSSGTLVHDGNFSVDRSGLVGDGWFRCFLFFHRSLFTIDASSTNWGAPVAHLSTVGVWSQAVWNSNLREMEAVFLAPQEFTVSFCQARRSFMHGDNTTVAYLNKQVRFSCPSGVGNPDVVFPSQNFSGRQTCTGDTQCSSGHSQQREWDSAHRMDVVAQALVQTSG